jgi:hypothetical protein
MLELELGLFRKFLLSVNTVALNQYEEPRSESGGEINR